MDRFTNRFFNFHAGLANLLLNSALCERGSDVLLCIHFGPLTRYVKLRVAHAPGMPGTFSLAADFKGNRKLAITACIPARASRTCRDACPDRLPAVAGRRSRHYRRMRARNFTYLVRGPWHRRPLFKNSYPCHATRPHHVLGYHDVIDKNYLILSNILWSSLQCQSSRRNIIMWLLQYTPKLIQTLCVFSVVGFQTRLTYFSRSQLPSSMEAALSNIGK